MLFQKSSFNSISWENKPGCGFVFIKQVAFEVSGKFSASFLIPAIKRMFTITGRDSQ